MRKIKLIKVSDNTPGGNNNGVQVGYEVEGLMPQKPTIGTPFNMVKEKEYLGKPAIMPVFYTASVVSELDENNEFRSNYSTYKIEYLDGKGEN